jgi:hypothetical protein
MARIYTIDTNAGPILERSFSTTKSVREYVERSIPLLRKRGYSCTWERKGRWHVVRVLNSKGREVHAAAFREGPIR